MAKERPEAVDMARRALADLTARISDLDGHTGSLSKDQFASLFDGVTDKEATIISQKMAIGYGSLATKLVVELARAKNITHAEVVGILGQWTLRME